MTMNPLAADLNHVLAHTEGLWEELRGNRIFITGATGFFGCWLLESFAWANDQLIRHLHQHKVSTRLLFGGNLVRQPAYRDIVCRKVGDLKNADFVMDRVFWIGVYPGLTAEHIQFMVETLHKLPGS
jgi:CDP-6-deoxy-D-xylo-4-hexulose-3-dehydrase